MVLLHLALQKLSDLVCLENGLSIIKPRKPSEREKRTTYPQKETLRSEICADINSALLQKPEDFEKLLKLLMEQGYEIKRGKNLAIKGKSQKRFIRFKSLGAGYTETDLKDILAEKSEQSPERKENGKRGFHKKKEFDLLIDIPEKDTRGKGAGYTRWRRYITSNRYLRHFSFCGARGS